MQKIYFLKSTAFLLFILTALFICKVLIEANIKENVPPVSLRKVVGYLSEENPREATIAGMSVMLGFGEVATDFLFLQAIQYFGDWELPRERKFKMVYPVIRATVTISPHFVPGYYFGALVFDELGYIDTAVDLLNEGISNNTRAFELWLYRDFTIRLFKTKEYKKAIEGIKKALQLKGHPPILDRILAYAYEKDGQIDKAISQWGKIYISTEDPGIKAICRKNIARLIKEGSKNENNKKNKYNEKLLPGGEIKR